MRWRMFTIGTTAAVALAACGGAASTTPAGGNPAANIPTPPQAALVGAGSTFDAPVLQAAAFAYNQRFNQVQLNYQSIGSGGGIQQFDAGTVNFGATDVPALDSEVSRVGPESTAQIPVILGTVGMAYNLPGISGGRLRLTPELIAGIFLGKITAWNDLAIKAQNRGLDLPAMKITTVHRSDGSGTTYIFSDYLAKVSSDWKRTVGTGKSLNWPVGVGQKGNEGVATTVQQTPGGLGYVELAYIVQTKMTQAMLENRDGRFVLPSPQGATAAAQSVPAPTPKSFSIVDAAGPDSAPISGYSWILLNRRQPDDAKGTALVDFWDWFIHDGQTNATALHYSALPANVAAADRDLLRSVVGQAGSPLLKG